jgi:hypothetical protein
MSKKPTHAQIRAVQKVLYNHARMQKLEANFTSAANLMNPTDQFGNPLGPTWYYPDGSGYDKLVTQAAGYADQVASILYAISGDLRAVKFPAQDKQHLRNALNAEAASWRARAAAWRDPNPPADVQATVDGIDGHLQTMANNVQHVQRYLKPRSAVLPNQPSGTP